MQPARRYLMFISYVGTAYRGSQLQTSDGSVPTIQYVIENALKNVYRLPGKRPITVFMGSRTDAGVHALQAAVHGIFPPFPFSRKYLKPKDLQYKLNEYLVQSSDSVRILDIHWFNEPFLVSSALLHRIYLCRVGILKKEYYEKKNFRLPIMEINRTCFSGKNEDFDISKARQAASLFEGEKDFIAVSGRPSRNSKSTICNVMSFKVEEAQPLVPFDPLAQRFNYYHFICKGNRFLNQMVRRMVTVILSAGYNAVQLNDIENLFNNPTPSSWPKCAVNVVSGNGLYLVETVYDMEKLKQESDKVVEEDTKTTLVKRPKNPVSLEKIDNFMTVF